MKEKLFDEEFLTLSELPAFEEYTFWENLKDRKIIINQSIDDSIIERAVMQILKFNEEDEGKDVAARKPIKLYINSDGGVVTTGMILCNVIENSKTPVYGIALRAYSMAGLILLPCHKRMAYPFATILLHDGSLGLVSSSKKAKETMKFYDDLEERTKKFILKYTNITEEKYKEKYGEEWFLFANEARELGIIDEIIGE